MTQRPPYKRAGKYACKVVSKVGVLACKGLFWICCGPCILCAICLIKPRSCVARTQSYCPPRPMTPKPRLRSLTLPLVEMQDDQKTFVQFQSSFFTKLPLEIRRMVYIEIIGGVTISLRTYNGKPLAQRYRCSGCPCRDSARPHRRELGFGLTSLRTCRQMYSEAIEFLYTSNTFSISTWDDDHATVDYMSYYFLPHRITQIQQLRIDWELDSFSYNHLSSTTSGGNSFEAWKKSWDALRSMTGIRQLRIVLYFRWREVYDCYEQYWRKYESELLNPVKSITAPKNFVLVLPDRRCSTNADLGSSSCVLQRPITHMAEELGQTSDLT
ncbi:hypothetical protein SVAN01_01185 [Stagonosporopsis vannaccii]|nr:hypothetical protein SVAN01_01185 [Stagonosporopsis vannaccii]